MAIVLFTSEKYIKDTSVIDENVDVKVIRDMIEVAQDLHILPLLGTGLYDELSTQINADTLTSDNTTLMGYVVKALKWWVLYEGIDHFTFKITNKSLLKPTDENSVTASLQELQRIKADFRNKAELYSQRTTDFLRENHTTYPLFDNPGAGVDTIHPKRRNFTSGLWLGRGSNCVDNPNKYDIDYGDGCG